MLEQLVGQVGVWNNLRVHEQSCNEGVPVREPGRNRGASAENDGEVALATRLGERSERLSGEFDGRHAAIVQRGADVTDGPLPRRMRSERVREGTSWFGDAEGEQVQTEPATAAG
ncbi:hypothetical protein GCM10010921_13700 [Microbacterium album]|uniref:Uncharacterized protein n=1 Tax=Microbacterium album TaxID=2053191 RepID=A0A917IGE3_9MICO|nr:hypothetical protein GCM10010921_13700 [Microbacterium album]